ncbi:group XIIB secretory phospholipase A2-like protein, partial [Acipenser oxyrinchus oxyrinchus]
WRKAADASSVSSPWIECGGRRTLGINKLGLGIPAMTKCCNQLDHCYDTCGTNKYRCDTKFRWCLYGICSDLKKSLGLVSKVEGQSCESVADTLFNTVWTLGCKTIHEQPEGSLYL